MTINNKTVLAIIPARAGSRRCPQKNTTLYQGRSLIDRAIDHALASEYIDQTVVSSDDPNILLIAAQRLVIPLPRPDYLSNHDAKSEAVILHALYHLPPPQDSYTPAPIPDLFVLLQPTSPLRTTNDIDSALELAFSSSPFSSHLSTIVSVNQETQKRNGAIYISESKRFLARLDLDADRSYKMHPSRSLDIDYPQDFFTTYTTQGSWKLP